ncbi:hypothetical protein ACYTYC_09595, partial [Streptococcus pyogenes]
DVANVIQVKTHMQINIQFHFDKLLSEGSIKTPVFFYNLNFLANVSCFRPQRVRSSQAVI